jgi:hypothetical protein
MAFVKNKNFRNFLILKRHFSQSELEWKNAKSFKDIPGPRSVFAFLPGGKYFNKPLNELLVLMRKDFGDIHIIPGGFGQLGFTAVYKPQDVEKVFRNEGEFNIRFKFNLINDVFRKISLSKKSRIIRILSQGTST